MSAFRRFTEATTSTIKCLKLAYGKVRGAKAGSALGVDRKLAKPTERYFPGICHDRSEFVAERTHSFGHIFHRGCQSDSAFDRKLSLRSQRSNRPVALEQHWDIEHGGDEHQQGKSSNR